MIGTYFGDYDHLEAFGFELVSGRNFNRDIPSDSSACLINQAAVKEFGWDDPLGKELFYPGDQREYMPERMGLYEAAYWSNRMTREGRDAEASRYHQRVVALQDGTE